MWSSQTRSSPTHLLLKPFVYEEINWIKAGSKAVSQTQLFFIQYEMLLLKGKNKWKLITFIFCCHSKKKAQHLLILRSSLFRCSFANLSCAGMCLVFF